MKNLRFTIGTKILLSFLLLIGIFAANAGYSIYTLDQSDKTIRRNREVTDPSVNSLNEFRHMVTSSKMLITNWVYMFGNTADQAKLDSLHRYEYPALRAELEQLSKKWNNKKQKEELDSVLISFDMALVAQREEIMNNLSSFEDYENSMVKFVAEDNLSSIILPQLGLVEKRLEKLAAIKMAEKDQADEEQIAAFGQLSMFTIISGLVVVFMGLLVAFIITRSITKPIATVKEVVQKLSVGILPEKKNLKFGKDEVGEMAAAVEILVEGLRSTSMFAENIGKGNYQSEFEPLSQDDVLGNALIDMRSNLSAVAEEDKRRNWATEGLAQFGDILRKNNDDINVLSDIIISNLVKYMKANQGGLYIVNDEGSGEPYLEMIACYAWDKKKYVEQKVYQGEGLTGQAWIEKDTIFLTDIPEEYITITSGLGESNPTSIIIVPLMVNEKVYGVIEIASFNMIEKYETAFVEKMAESIASTLSSVKINERTQKLLEDSTQLTEQMRAQEEEMRQNMEELQATQEEMERGQQDRQAKESIINATHMMLELDRDFKIDLVNSVTTKILGYSESELRSAPFSSLVISLNEFKQAMAKAEQGGSWSGIIHLKNKSGEEVVAKISAGKMEDAFNDSVKYLILASDISEVLVKE